MAKELTWPFIAIIMLAFVIGVLVLCSIIVFKQAPETNIPTIDVTGTAKLTAAPDKVDISLTVETENESADVSQKDNAVIMNRVRSALQSLGIAVNDTKTIAYYLYPYSEYDRNGTIILKGYRTTHALNIEVTDLNKSGAVIDAVVSAGANRIDSISFGLTDEKSNALKDQARLNALDNAKKEAVSIAERAGVVIRKMMHFTESSGYTPPYSLYEKAAGSVPSVPTEITPGEVEITSTVSITYEIG